MTVYRRDIDGLRGISILLVLFFHAKIPFFSGGYFGVDIFFVISGFLITSIILKLNSKNKFSIIYFYERRVRRIIPALYVVLFFLCAYSIFFQSPYFSKDLSQSIFFTPLFLQNFFNIYEQAQYFSLSYDFKSLGHTWSLSIEEQFYFFYPLFFLVLIKLTKNNLKYFLLIIFLLSLFYYLYLGMDSNISRLIFFFSPARIWEILAGCLISINFSKIKKSKSLNIFGLSLIFFCMFFQEIFEGSHYLRIFVVVGTSIILINTFDHNKCLIVKILSNTYLVYLGLISYSLYLWHVPIFSIYRDFFTFKLNLYEIIILIILSILVSYISYKYIETPFRKNKKISKKFIFYFFFGGIVFFTSFGYFGHSYDGFENFKINKLSEKRKKFYISFLDERKKIEDFKINTTNKDFYKILVIGDSLASDVVNSLKTQNVYSERLNINGPCFDKLIKNKYSCNIKLKNVLKKASDFEIVIIATDFGNENSEKGGIKLYNFLIQNKIKTKIVGGLNFKYVSSSSYRFARYNFYKDYKNFYFKNVQPNIYKINQYISTEAGDNFIDKFKAFCDYKKKECSIYNKYFTPLFYDTKHLTVEGYNHFGKYLMKKL
tara:strand:+ start:1966 stop:3768 length:1803 start_codon:yes stop_codon:yes gene_type:complete